MSQINDRYIEAYKQLDKLCMEVFRADKGVTSYIDAMEETRGGAWKVPNWNNDLQKLKSYRHIRNNYVHEVGSTYSDICTEEDILWLDTFYNAIMQSSDPLAVYRKKTEEEKMKARKPVTPPPVESVPKEPEKKSSSAGYIIFIIITLLLICGSIIGCIGLISCLS